MCAYSCLSLAARGRLIIIGMISGYENQSAFQAKTSQESPIPVKVYTWFESNWKCLKLTHLILVYFQLRAILKIVLSHLTNITCEY